MENQQMNDQIRLRQKQELQNKIDKLYDELKEAFDAAKPDSDKIQNIVGQIQNAKEKGGIKEKSPKENTFIKEKRDDINKERKEIIETKKAIRDLYKTINFLQEFGMDTKDLQKSVEDLETQVGEQEKNTNLLENSLNALTGEQINTQTQDNDIKDIQRPGQKDVEQKDMSQEKLQQYGQDIQSSQERGQKDPTLKGFETKMKAAAKHGEAEYYHEQAQKLGAQCIRLTEQMEKGDTSVSQGSIDRLYEQFYEAHDKCVIACKESIELSRAFNRSMGLEDNDADIQKRLDEDYKESFARQQQREDKQFEADERRNHPEEYRIRDAIISDHNPKETMRQRDVALMQNQNLIDKSQQEINDPNTPPERKQYLQDKVMPRLEYTADTIRASFGIRLGRAGQYGFELNNEQKEIVKEAWDNVMGFASELGVKIPTQGQEQVNEPIDSIGPAPKQTQSIGAPTQIVKPSPAPAVSIPLPELDMGGYTR